MVSTEGGRPGLGAPGGSQGLAGGEYLVSSGGESEEEKEAYQRSRREILETAGRVQGLFGVKMGDSWGELGDKGGI